MPAAARHGDMRHDQEEEHPYRDPLHRVSAADVRQLVQQPHRAVQPANVLDRHDRDITTIVGHFKSHATRELTRLGIHPLAGHTGKRGGLPTPWSEGCWKVFIDDAAQLAAAIAYVQRHPAKEGLPAQTWSFLKTPSNAAYR